MRKIVSLSVLMSALLLMQQSPLQAVAKYDTVARNSNAVSRTGASSNSAGAPQVGTSGYGSGRADSYSGTYRARDADYRSGYSSSFHNYGVQSVYDNNGYQYPNNSNDGDSAGGYGFGHVGYSSADYGNGQDQSYDMNQSGYGYNGQNYDYSYDNNYDNGNATGIYDYSNSPGVYDYSNRSGSYDYSNGDASYDNGGMTYGDSYGYGEDQSYAENEYGSGYVGKNTVDDCCKDCGECLTLCCCYQPSYYNAWKCIQVPRTCKKKCCRYVPRTYEVQHCRYIPQYYKETCCCYVPEYYYVDETVMCEKWVTERKCQQVPRYYYKRSKCQPCCQP